ncbi:MAG: cysteine hydrolase [Rhodospirillales bacterium]
MPPIIPSNSALIAMHYQNENCHPDGKIKVGIAQDADWRWQRLNNAKRLFTGARDVQIPIVHVRLAVPPDYRGVVANTPLIHEWMALGAWKEDTWGVEFVEGLEPKQGEPIITHIRNSGFHGSTLLDILNGLSARHLICCGVSTAYAVEGTVRQAADIGFEVTVAADACSTATQAQHANALAAMNLIADVKTVDRILEDFK